LNNKRLVLTLPTGKETTGHIWNNESSSVNGRLHTFRRAGVEVAYIRADGTYVGQVSGSIETAARLTTPRTIALSGDAGGSVVFDGSANVVLDVTLNPAHTHQISDVVNLEAALDGKAEVSHGHAAEDIDGGTISGNITIAGDFTVTGRVTPGLLHLPLLDEEDRDAIVDPAVGTIIMNSDIGRPEVFVGGYTWETLAFESDIP